jgi:transposase-like protein
MSKKGGGTSGNPKLTLLWQTDPQQAAAKVRAALEGVRAEDAARTLGVGRRTLFRWLKKMGDT